MKLLSATAVITMTTFTVTAAIWLIIVQLA